jgi:hypothetical protein
VIERKEKKREKDQNGSVTGLFKRNSGTSASLLLILLSSCYA